MIKAVGLPNPNLKNQLPTLQRAVEILNGLQGARTVGERAVRVIDLVDAGILATDAAGNLVIGSSAGDTTWAEITGKPLTFAPSAHTHPTSDVVGYGTFAVDISITGASRRIFADFTAAVGTRAFLQTSVANSATAVGALPSGTGTTALFGAFGGSDPANTHQIQLRADATAVIVGSAAAGTGTLRDISFQFNSVEKAILTTAGAFITVGDIASRTNVTAQPASSGYISMTGGDAVGTGYLTWHSNAGVRAGYLGYALNSVKQIQLAAENGYAFRFSGARFECDDDFRVKRDATPTTGAIFFGNTLLKYLFFDGTGFQLSGGDMLMSGALTIGGAYTSGTPSGGTAGAWKLGTAIATAGLTLNTTKYIELDIGGTLHKVATVN